ncbi:MAG: 3-methyl-2-oxobutanoate hydroxymethyltransferase [Betaproteobacteria bacterium]|nr:3-methyl-2-oxobutanoate hydroxymethyltransferase [Betaproteobacteria bacterium]
MSAEPDKPRRKITIRELQAMKTRREPILALGVYDSVVAGIADELGIHILMNGPSGPMALFGHSNPAAITEEEQLATLKAVTRVSRYALTNAHMPYMSYQSSERDAVLNAGRLVARGGADTVKCDANAGLAKNIRAIVQAGIPVIAHIGLQASRRIEQSGYGVKGKTFEDAARIVEDAWALLDAGVFTFVVEHVAPELMAYLTQTLPVPVLSLGSGPDADGVSIVSGDVLNYSAFARPAHAGQFADLRQLFLKGIGTYAQQVRSGEYPQEKDAPTMDPVEFKKLNKMLRSGKPVKAPR